MLHSPDEDLSVHLLTYEHGNERFLYMQSIEQEKTAMKHLSERRQRIEADIALQGEEVKEETLAESIERRSTRHIIAVDSREFSSLTPIHLYEAGFWVVPIVLTVGDYVLSDQICIERKAVATGDLFESFKSGRLLQQVSNMNQFYKKPVLLIEFEEGIPFKLRDQRADNTTGAEVSQQSVISKISLLSLHFPNLQIIWIRSPKHTAEIFMDLKNSLKEAERDPDLMKIEKIGKVGNMESLAKGIDELDLENEMENTQQESFGKLLPKEFLKRIPGVNSNNMPQLMAKCKNMVELANLEYEQLKEIVGPKNAKMIKSFLETKVN